MREQLGQRDEPPLSCQHFGTRVMFRLFEAKIKVAGQRLIGRDPTVPLLATYPKELKTQTNICAHMFKTALFTVVKR